MSPRRRFLVLAGLTLVCSLAGGALGWIVGFVAQLAGHAALPLVAALILVCAFALAFYNSIRRRQQTPAEPPDRHLD